MNAATGAPRVPIIEVSRVERMLLRMAWQIWEHNSSRHTVTLVGIADNGEHIARRLAAHLQSICPLKVTTLRLDMNKREPLESRITLSQPVSDSSIVLVDDVANSGKTLMYALRPLMEATPEKILIAVLVDRKHKSFPVAPDIIGQRVATTLQENILVTIEGDTIAAYLE